MVSDFAATSPRSAPAARWLVAVLFLLLGLIGVGLHHITIINRTETAPQRLTQTAGFSVDALTDLSGKLTLNDVQSPAFAPSFQPLDLIRYQLAADTVWYRIALPETFPTEHTSVIAPDSVNASEIVFYAPAGGIWKTQVNGQSLRWTQRAIPSVVPAFEFTLPAHVPRVLYMRSTSAGLRAHAWEIYFWPDAAKFYRRNNFRMACEIGYFSLWLGLLIYNGFLYAVLRQAAYLHYLAYAFCFGAWLSVFSNFFNILMPWPTGPLRALTDFGLLKLTTLSLVLFSRSFLSTRQNAPGLDRLLRWLSYVLLLTLPLSALSFLPIGYSFNNETQLYLNIATLCLMIVTGLVLYRRGLRQAALYLLAFLPPFGTLVWMLVINHGWMSSPRSGSILIYYFGAFELIILSIALAWRHRHDADDAAELRANYTTQLESDVTARTHELSQLSVRLAEANRDKDRVFSIIGHDLRGPVQSLRSLISMLNENEVGFTPAETKALLSDIDRASQAQLDLLENLLNWGKLQSGQSSLEPIPVPLAAAMEGVVTLLAPMARTKEIEIFQEISPEITPWADLQSLQAILRNLINNALKFTERGGKIHVSATQSGQSVVIKIHDNGIGIEPARLSTLSLHVVKSSYGTESEKGTGLGLVLCRDLILANHGELRFESQLSRGTTAILVLPTAPE